MGEEHDETVVVVATLWLHFSRVTFWTLLLKCSRSRSGSHFRSHCRSHSFIFFIHNHTVVVIESQKFKKMQCSYYETDNYFGYVHTSDIRCANGKFLVCPVAERNIPLVGHTPGDAHVCHSRPTCVTGSTNFLPSNYEKRLLATFSFVSMADWRVNGLIESVEGSAGNF
jgi:hypothetical protein